VIRLFRSAAWIVISLLFILMPFTVQAKVDWAVTDAVHLDAVPIDVAHSLIGDRTFVLTEQAKVLIYTGKGTLVGTVPVDPAVTAIAISANGEQLYLINSKRKTLQTIDIGFIVAINTANSPFLGPAGAAVEVVVFSDFQ